MSGTDFLRHLKNDYLKIGFNKRTFFKCRVTCTKLTYKKTFVLQYLVRCIIFITSSRIDDAL